jgi:hypothetical protein
MAQFGRRPAVGLGEDLWIEAKEMVAAALVHGGKVVHLSGFAREHCLPRRQQFGYITGAGGQGSRGATTVRN